MNEPKKATNTRRNVRKPVTATIETATIVAEKESNMTTKTTENTAATVTAAPVVTAPAKRTRRAATIDPGAASALRVMLTGNTTVFFTQDNRKPGREPGTTIGAYKFIHIQGGKAVNITRLLARALGVVVNVNGAINTTSHAEGLREELAEGLDTTELTFEESF